MLHTCETDMTVFLSETDDEDQGPRVLSRGDLWFPGYMINHVTQSQEFLVKRGRCCFRRARPPTYKHRYPLSFVCLGCILGLALEESLLMSRAYLPPGLLDLVLARTLVPVPSARGLSILNSALQSRFAHSAAAVQLQESTSPYAQVDHSLYAQCVQSVHSVMFHTNQFGRINPRRSAKEKQLSPYSTPLPRSPLTTLEEQLRSLKNTIVTEVSCHLVTLIAVLTFP